MSETWKNVDIYDQLYFTSSRCRSCHSKSEALTAIAILFLTNQNSRFLDDFCRNLSCNFSATQNSAHIFASLRTPSLIHFPFRQWRTNAKQGMVHDRRYIYSSHFYDINEDKISRDDTYLNNRQVIYMYPLNCRLLDIYRRAITTYCQPCSTWLWRMNKRINANWINMFEHFFWKLPSWW